MPRRVQKDPRPRVETQRGFRSNALPVDWPARRDAVRKRDKTCRWLVNETYCESTERLEVDHIGDPNDHSLPNLRLLCHAHHNQRTQQQAAAARQANRKPRKRPEERHPGLL